MKLRFNRTRFWKRSLCPSRDDWSAIVCGLIPDEIANANLKHAATCASCGRRLRDAIHLLDEQVTAEEELAMLELPSHGAAWRQEMADEMARRSQRTPLAIEAKTRHSWKLAFFVGSATVLVCAALAIGVRLRREMSPAALIAEAYSEHRTVELRFRGAKNSPLRTERGGIPSNLDRPASLLHAEAKIADELARNSNDATLLDYKAEADLLDGNYDTAIQSLLRATASVPSSDDLRTDLATAYFMRAEATKRAIDYGRAVDLLGQVLAHDPDDNTARFNRAIAEERLLLFEQAIADWEEFVRTEKEKGWLAEGRDRLDSVKAREGDRNQLLRQPPLAPSAAIHALSQPDLPGKNLRGVTPTENYLELALTAWLPLLAEPRGPASDDAWKAVILLSKALEDQHRDDWLRDLVRTPHSPAWQRGIAELARAAQARSRGDAPSLVMHAKRSIEQFRLAHNFAGSAAGNLEYMNGLNHLGMGNACRGPALDGLTDTANRHYPWVEANLLLEFSTCAGSDGDEIGAESNAKQAATIADQSHYESLRIKAKFYLDGVSAPWVAASDSWDRMRSGLEEFWQSQSLPIYGANFYVDMTFAAEAEKLWYLAEGVAKESVVWHERSEDSTAKASAHHYLAEAAEAANDPHTADKEFARAGYLLEHSPDVNRAAIVTLNVERASWEVRQNRLVSAANLLNRARPDVQELKTEYVSLPYYEALGELYLRTNELQLAEDSLFRAIHLIESTENSPQAARDQVAWHQDNSRPYRDLVELYAGVEHDSERSFAIQEKLREFPLQRIRVRAAVRRSLPSDSRRPGTESAITRSSWPSTLPTNTAILSSMTFPSGTAVWLADSDGVALHWLNVPAPQIQSTAEQFARLCTDPDSDVAMIRRYGLTLYKWFIEPFGSRLQSGGTIVFEPDESLGPIPFQALVMPNGKYLSESFTIAESLGAGAGSAGAHNRISPSDAILAVGDPQAAEFENTHLPPLPAADEEAQNVALKFDHHNVLSGSDATLPHVRELLQFSSVFHFAGHAILTNSDPALVLSSEKTGEVSLLDATQLSSLNLSHLRLAVMSGCETADADQGIYDADNLVRMLARAGVPEIVASSWRVDSQTTSVLMNVFYSELLQGKSVSVALGAAEFAVRQRPETSHPYYWAAFANFES